jgi:hypothetical protein
MTFFCIECEKKLNADETDIGFCNACNAKVENDFSILRQSEDDSFSYIAETMV